MNKLQQEIIEIIEPYCDKTLSEGCYIKSDFYNTIWRFMYKAKWIIISDSEWRPLCIENDIEIKIIWHYDITAVLKCFENNKHLFLMEEWYFKSYWDYRNIKFPNKPLHLYTEQENVSLLELLKKLWTD